MIGIMGLQKSKSNEHFESTLNNSNNSYYMMMLSEIETYKQTHNIDIEYVGPKKPKQDDTIIMELNCFNKKLNDEEADFDIDFNDNIYNMAISMSMGNTIKLISFTRS